MLQLALARRSAERERLWSQRRSPTRRASCSRYRGVLPFTLTDAQEQAIARDRADSARTMPMQRLLQGDVGSGKTVVAHSRCCGRPKAGRRSRSWRRPRSSPSSTSSSSSRWLAGSASSRAAVGLAAGEGARARRQRGRRWRRSLVGTHALFQEGVECRDLGLAIVDEQHRFGVAQRLALRQGSRAARPDDDGDADPAHAGDDVLRRSRRVGDRHDHRRAASRS